MEQPNISQTAPFRKRSLSKWQIATVVLVVVIVVQAILTVVFITQFLNSDYQSLNSQYTALQQQHAILENEHSQLQSDFNSYQNGYSQLRAQINLHSTHPSENEKQLVTPDDPEVVRTMRQVTGGWSNPSDWNEYWGDVEKLYNWMRDNIDYAKDPAYPSLPQDPAGSLILSGDNWQFPNETLRTKQGDCEDQALLLQSMVLAYNSQKYAVYSIVITTHVGVFFPVVDDQICILDSAGSYMTNSGWPSYSITQGDIRQETNDWLSHIGGNQQVERVFTDSEWKTFSGTEDFITWMYNR